MNRKNIEQLAIDDIKTWSEKQGLVISDEDAKAALDRIAKRIEENIVNGSSTERPRGFLPSNARSEARPACGTSRSTEQLDHVI